MIIKIIPENDAEKAKIQDVEHTGVKEFFIFGNKNDSDKDPVDFHDWSGSYRYLVGSLHYFTSLLSDEMSSKSANQPTEINLQAAPHIIPLQADDKGKGLIKKSNAEDGKIEGIVELKPEDGKSKKAKRPNLTIVDTDAMEVEEDAPNDNSNGAED